MIGKDLLLVGMIVQQKRAACIHVFLPIGCKQMPCDMHLVCTMQDTTCAHHRRRGNGKLPCKTLLDSRDMAGMSL